MTHFATNTILHVPMPLKRRLLIQSLFDSYIEMYTSRDKRLIEHFSEDFSGYTGGGDFLVKSRDEWVEITLRDFAQVPGRIHVEMLDLSLNDLSDTVVAATALFHILLPIPENVLSKEAVRLTLVFRLEKGGWKISHSGISVPYFLVREGEVYPIKGLYERNQELEVLIQQHMLELAEAKQKVASLNRLTQKVRKCIEERLNTDNDLHSIAKSLNLSARTLSRRLGEEGTTFAQVKDDLRREIALHLLRESKKSIGVISEEIGFSSQTAFFRAFRTWTGQTPRAYRLASESKELVR